MGDMMKYFKWMITEDADYVSVNLIPKMVVKKRKSGDHKGKWYYKLIEDKIVSEYFSDHVEALSAASAIADFDEEE